MTQELLVLRMWSATEISCENCDYCYDEMLDFHTPGSLAVTRLERSFHCLTLVMAVDSLRLQAVILLLTGAG